MFFINISHAQYTNPTKQKKNKMNIKTKELKENAIGDEGIHKDYKNKPARKESKEESKSVDITPAAVKKKAADMKKNGNGDEAVPPKVKYNNPNPPPKVLFVDHSKENLRNQIKTLKDNAVGDMIDNHQNDVQRNLSTGIRTMEISDNQSDLRKRNGKMNASSSGDVSEDVWKGRLSTRENNGVLAGSTRGNFAAKILQNNKKKIKSADGEMGSSQGDFVNGYMITKGREESNSQIQTSYQGSVSVRANLTKEKSKEMSFSQGDIIGSYIDKVNRERSKSAQIENYSGTIDLKKIKGSSKENSHIQAVSMGDISSMSKESKNNNMRNRMKKMSDYKGEILLTNRRKGSHPSAVYISGRTSKSLAEREKLRKNAIKKAKRNRSIEDPAYMKKSEPRPRFETEEYKIWEGKSR